MCRLQYPICLLYTSRADDGEHATLLLDGLAAGDVRGRALVDEALAVLVHVAAGAVHGRGYGKEGVDGEARHMDVHAGKGHGAATAVPGLFGHQVAVAVLVLAHGLALGEILGAVVLQQVEVVGHAARGQHHSLGVDVGVGAILVQDLHAGAGVLVVEQQGGGARVQAQLQVGVLGAVELALQALDDRRAVAAADAALVGFPVFCLICPVGLTLAVVVGIYRAIFQQDPTVSLLIFAVILLVEVVFFRKWCHKFCPIGALMGLVGAKAPFLRPRVAADKRLREQGIDCQACVKACPEQLDPHTASIPECTKCGQCAEACPVGAISFRKRAGAGVPATADAKGQAKRPGAGCPQPAMAEERDFEEELISELP